MKSNNKKGLSDWLGTHSNSKADESMLEAIWDASEKYGGGFEPDVEAGLNRFQDRIGSGMEPKVVSITSKRPFLRVAAAVAAILVAGYAYVNFSSENTSPLLQVSTSIDETKNIFLADGSSVSLNGNTVLDHPEVFDENKRIVHLDGEAFFDVEKMEAKPFQIETKSGMIEVLGTSFNVREVKGEETMEVFVKTGKVAVTIPTENKRYILTPGQTLIHNKTTGKSKIIKEKAENPIAWKTKVLRFRNAPLDEIMEEMERVYNVDIEVENEKLANCPFTTSLKEEKLKDAFKVLEASCDLTFNVVSPGKIKVSGKCCE